MVITKIRTVRNYETCPSYHLVYEWEDVFKKKLNVPFIFEKKCFSIYLRVINKILTKVRCNIPISFLLNTKKYELIWDMGARTHNSYVNRSNVIPCIIDFFIQKNRLNDFLYAYSRIPFLLISSAEACSFLKENKYPKRYYHFPLSLSDKYKITESTHYTKKYDLVLLGRTNSVLNDFLSRYVKVHPDFIYVTRSPDGEFNYYTSRGDYIGCYDGREKYIELMRESKIGLYSTPGIDGGEVRTKGFNQVTPRFLEYLACGCHIIARYYKNPDTDFYKLEDFSPSIDTYEDFERALDYAKANPVDMKKYAHYLENHYTSKRVELLKEILEQQND